MSKEASFDIVSTVDMQEVQNAVNQTAREIETRFDFKNTDSEIHFDGKVITMISSTEYKLGNILDVLQTKCVKRGVSLKALKLGKIEPAAGGKVRQVIHLQQGIDQEHARQIIKLIKDTKLKVQASIQGDQVRVSGKSKDDLQSVIQTLRQADFPIPLQFVNYR